MIKIKSNKEILLKCLSSFVKEKSNNRLLNNFEKHTLNAFFRNKGSSIVNDSRIINPQYNHLSYAMSKTDGLHLLCDTFGDRINTFADLKPNSICYKFSLTNQSFSFLEIKQRVDDIAQNLLKMGFNKGDRIALLLPNIPETNLTLLAAAKIGLVVVLMNPAYQLVEIEYMLRKTGAKGIVILDNFKILHHYDMIANICPELLNSVKGELNSKKLPNLKHVIIATNKLIKDPKQKTQGTWQFNELEKFDGIKKETPQVDMDDSMVILFTSGTTGFPKGAVLSHFNLLNSAYLEFSSTELVNQNRITCCPIPVFHVFGLIVGGLSPFTYGAKSVLPALLPDTLSTMKAIHTERCTSLKGAPVIFIDILNHPDRKKFDLSSLEYMLIGASTVPKSLLLELKKELKFKSIITGCGMSETSAAGLITRPADVDISERYAYESIGQPLPFVEIKIIDRKGNIVPHNTDGEMCMRGYNVMKGYWDDAVKTAETINESGWLKTGDVACMDENGYVFFKSRAKEIVIRGGVNIYPAEVEAFFRTNEHILDISCFGVESKRYGEELCAWVKLKPNSKNITEKDLVKFCEDKIAFFKIPKYFKFVDSFPINANGKIVKSKMTEQMKKELNL